MLEKKSQRDLIEERRNSFLEKNQKDKSISCFNYPMYPSQFKSFMKDYCNEFDGFQGKRVNNGKYLCYFFLKNNIIL